MNIAPPPAINPASLELEKPTHRRDQVIPAGYKRVYHGHQPHQGSREMQRRAKQLAKASEPKGQS